MSPLTGAARDAHTRRVLIDEARDLMRSRQPGTPDAVATLLALAAAKGRRAAS